MGEAALGQAADVATEDALSPEALGLLKTMAPCSLSLGDVNDKVLRTQALRPVRETIAACMRDGGSLLCTDPGKSYK